MIFVAKYLDIIIFVAKYSDIIIFVVPEYLDIVIFVTLDRKIFVNLNSNDHNHTLLMNNHTFTAFLTVDEISRL